MGLEEQRVALKEAREARIGATAEKIMLSYAEKKPGDFLSVGFAQKVRDVALVLQGDQGEPVPVKSEAEAETEVDGNAEGELDLDAG